MLSPRSLGIPTHLGCVQDGTEDRGVGKKASFLLFFNTIEHLNYFVKALSRSRLFPPLASVSSSAQWKAGPCTGRSLLALLSFTLLCHPRKTAVCFEVGGSVCDLGKVIFHWIVIHFALTGEAGQPH